MPFPRLRPSTAIHLALCDSYHARRAYVGLRHLRIGLRRSLEEHRRRQLGAEVYEGAGELARIGALFRRGVRELLSRFPSLDFADPRAHPDRDAASHRR